MKESIFDKRVSLWDLGMRELHIGNRRYVLQEPPKRGGSCMVYRVLWHEQIGNETEPHELLLKEFYPILDANESAGIHREADGTLTITEDTKVSGGYQQAYQRFLDSYRLMVKLGRMENAAEHSAVAFSLTEANGTWYVEEVYDTGQSLAEIFGNGDYSFDAFLTVFEKCMQAVARLHDLDFYHLDLKPQNISYTRRGVVKFFDVDSFVKKDRLGEYTVFYVTEGYSAPELQDVLYNPEDAPYLIGPWTDLYSMTQMLCWYLYGRPLEYEEIDGALEELRAKIQNGFGEYQPEISRKALYRLKLFMKCGLHPSKDKRYKRFEDAIEAIRQIRNYLLYREEGEPFDNFQECQEWYEEYEEICEQIDRAFFPTRGDEEMPVYYHGMIPVALTGVDQEERETIARFYATMHRLDYSNIIEIHCDDFTKITESIDGIDTFEGKELLNIRSVHSQPQLFLLFDESEKKKLSKKEAEELGKLTLLDKDVVLIIGRYNRCDQEWNPVKQDVFNCETIDLDAERSDQEIMEIKEILDTMEAEGTFERWSWKKCFLIMAAAAVLLIFGIWIAGLASELVNPAVHFDVSIQRDVYAFELLTQKGVWLHLLSTLLMAGGVNLLMYSVYYFRRPKGAAHFVGTYRWTILGIYAVIFALSLPEYFEASGCLYAILVLELPWKAAETAYKLFMMGGWYLGLAVVGYWIFELLNFRSAYRKRLKKLSWILLGYACFLIILQTYVNLGELLLYVIMLLGVIWSERLYYEC